MVAMMVLMEKGGCAMVSKVNANQLPLMPAKNHSRYHLIWSL
jgi:hypothetical protein